jgi:hypothetical protein
MRTMNSCALTGHVTHGPPNIEESHLESKGPRKMEQLPQWLAAAVDAAGMTAYAEGLEPRHLKHAPESKPDFDDDTPILPLH